MTLKTSISIDIPAELKNLDGVLAPKNRKKALTAVALKARSIVEPYAKSTAANNPPAPFYKRGTGTVFASGRVSRTSEVMSARWKQKVTANTAEISNTASYSGLVIGDQQTFYHAKRGWVNVPDEMADSDNLETFSEVYLKSLAKSAKVLR